MSLNPEYLTDLADTLHEIAAHTPELTAQHVVFNGEIKRKATLVQVAANLLRRVASGEAAAPRQVVGEGSGEPTP